MAKILIVEDDADLRTAVVDWLELEHFTIETAADGRTGLDLMASSAFDLYIFDWDLPGISGIELCRTLRREQSRAPIMILTGKSNISEKEQGLDSGADDYLTKPFNMRELSARIRALLRRTSDGKTDLLQVRNLILDTQKYKVSKDGQDIHLLPKEFGLLELLMRHPDSVFSTDALIQRVWASDSDATAEAVRTCVKRLRKKLEDEGAQPLIETVHRVGYRLNSH